MSQLTDDLSDFLQDFYSGAPYEKVNGYPEHPACSAIYVPTGTPCASVPSAAKFEFSVKGDTKKCPHCGKDIE